MSDKAPNQLVRVVTSDTIEDDSIEALVEKVEALQTKVGELEKENAMLRSAEAKLVTVADYIAQIMIDQKIENFTANNFDVDGKQLELICRFVEGKTMTTILDELRKENESLKHKLNERNAFLNELNEEDCLSAEGSERYQSWLDLNDEADIDFMPGMH